MLVNGNPFVKYNEEYRFSASQWFCRICAQGLEVFKQTVIQKTSMTCAGFEGVSGSSRCRSKWFPRFDACAKQRIDTWLGPTGLHCFVRQFKCLQQFQWHFQLQCRRVVKSSVPYARETVGIWIKGHSCLLGQCGHYNAKSQPLVSSSWSK